jgi:hypothetical protein
MLPSASRDMQVLQAHPCLRQRTAALSSLHGFFVASRVQIDRVLVVAMLIFFITDDFDVALSLLSFLLSLLSAFFSLLSSLFSLLSSL